jgi:hypothetical protein
MNESVESGLEERSESQEYHCGRESAPQGIFGDGESEISSQESTAKGTDGQTGSDPHGHGSLGHVGGGSDYRGGHHGCLDDNGTNKRNKG